MAFLHSAQLLYTDCGYPRWSVCFTLPNAIFFYMLFNDFYKVSQNCINPKNLFELKIFTFFFLSSLTQKSYSKKAKKAAALANGHLQNGKANGHIVKDLNHNVVVTKPNSGKKDH